MRASEARYTRTAIALHWIVAALLVVQVGWGFWMQGIAKVPQGPRMDAYNLHKSIGVLILALMLARIAWRAAHPPPPFPPMPRWQAVAARATHGFLYAALLLQPLSGITGSLASGYPLRLWGAVIPAQAAMPALKDAMSASHAVLGVAIVVAVLLHVAGALAHLGRHDGVLARMLPVRGRGA